MTDHQQAAIEAGARDRERAERVAEEERVRALRADPEEQAAIEALKAELRNKFSKSMRLDV